jgi:hypothetical protein
MKRIAERIALNDAFHRLICRGRSPEQAWKVLINALESGAVKLWCDGKPLALDYVVNNLRIGIRDGNIEVLPAGPIGWAAPSASYVFEIDSDFEQRPSLAPPPVDKQDVKHAAFVEGRRRDEAGLPLDSGVLYRWLEETFPNSILPTRRTVQSWLARWRDTIDWDEAYF